MLDYHFLIDAAIIVFYFVGIVLIGLYMGRRENSLHDFALGGRRVPWWAVMASIIAAETSAATFLGTPGEGYNSRSIAYTQLAVGLILGRILVGYVFLKPYYQYRVYTVYDYLSIRFGNKSKNYVSALFLIMRTLGSGTRLFVPAIVMVLAYKAMRAGGAIAFSTTSNELMLYITAIVLVTVLTCIYTSFGGIKAVIWTDVIQACLMFGSALVAMMMILYHISGDSWNFMQGLRKVGEHAPLMKSYQGYFLTGFEATPVSAWTAEQARLGSYTLAAGLSWWEYVRVILFNEYTLFAAIIGGIIGNMAAFGTDQDMVQRMLTAETYKKSRRSLITAAVMDLPIYALFSFIGVLLVVYFTMEPKHMPASTAHVFGSYIINVMPTGVRGIVLAGVFATAMGSLSAALNALATSFTNDWYMPYFAPGKSEKHYVGAARFFTGVFAFLMICIACAFAYVTVVDPKVRIIPVVVGIAGLFLGPMLGVFLVGMLTKRRGSDAGNIFAITVGLIAMLFFSGQHIEVMNLISHPTMSPEEQLANVSGRISSLQSTLEKHGSLVPPEQRTKLEKSLADLTAKRDRLVVDTAQGSAMAVKAKWDVPVWMPVIKWTWFAMFGSVIVFLIGILFRTPEAMVENARRRALQASAGDDRPVSLRD